MKLRLGYVSNSSSSSFIIRKSALNSVQLTQVRKLLYRRNGCYTTVIREDDDFILGWVEAHNAMDGDFDPLSTMLRDLIFDFKISTKNYLQKYEENVSEKDLNAEE